MKIVSAPFDPITNEELNELKQLKKQYRDVYVQVQTEGQLDYNIRIRLLKKALKPYRHLHVYTGFKQADPLTSIHSETLPRQGYLTHCVNGIRKEILQNGYYFKEIIAFQCNPHRAAHSLSVANVCQQLARAHGLDASLAYRMGLLHDITKNHSDEENKKVIERYYPEVLSMSPKVWHSQTAVIFLKQNFGLHNTHICNAIEHHTLGNGHSDYDAILYIADKIEPTRGYDVTRQMACAKKNLRLAKKMIYEESLNYRKKEENNEQ